MKIKRIHLRNFRQHADSEIHFGDGITGILGQNGSGKSTVIEAIAFALYGAEAIRGTKDTIRWDRAPARRVAEVTLTFDLEGKTYTVTRTETNARLEVGAGVIIADGTSAVNGYIPKLLGMGWKEFASSHLTAQKDLMRLATMGATERQAFFREVMGVSRVDQALAAARREKADLARERDGLAAGLGERAPLAADVSEAEIAITHAQKARQSAAEALEAARDALATAEEALQVHRELEAAAAQRRREIEEAEKELARTSAEIGTLSARIQAATEAGNRAETRAAELDRLADLRKERDELLSLRATSGERASVTEEIQRAKADLGRLREKAVELEGKGAAYDAAAHAAAKAQREQLMAEGSALANKRREIRAAAEANARNLEAARSREERKLKAIQYAGEAGCCPTCSRALGEQFGAVVSAIQQEIASLTAAHSEATRTAQETARPSEAEAVIARQIEQLDAELREHERLREQSASAASALNLACARIRATEESLSRLKARLEALPAAEFDADLLAEIEVEISRLEKVAQEVAADRALAAQRQELESERHQWLEKNGQAAHRFAEANDALSALGYDPEAHEAARRAHQEAEAQRQAAAIELAHAEGAVAAAEDRHVRAVRALEAYDARARQLTELEEHLRVASTAADRLADFRVAVASAIRPEMEELVTGFVSLLTDGRYEAVTISEDFSCTLHRDGVPVEVISGGEEDVVAVAMRLATSQMIAERAGHPLSLLILDEVFGSLDDVRRANALALFRRLRGIFEQILLISHIPESQHQVDHVVTVEFDPARGCSVVRGGSTEEAEVEPQLAEVA